jgi:hypothetical protein
LYNRRFFDGKDSTEAVTLETLPPLILRPSHGSVSLRLKDLWEYRELLYFLVWRDIKVRYKQTALGVVWAILQTFLTMVVFSIFFGRLAKLPSDGIPYPVFAYCALLPWQLFANALTTSGNSLVANQKLLTKVDFSTSAHPDIGRTCRAGRFRYRNPVIAGHDVILWHCPHGGSSDIAAVPFVRHYYCPDAGLMAVCTECPVSRRALHDPLSDAVLVSCNACCVLQQLGAGVMAYFVRAESYGWGGGMVSLGIVR